MKHLFPTLLINLCFIFSLTVGDFQPVFIENGECFGKTFFPHKRKIAGTDGYLQQQQYSLNLPCQA